MIAPGIAVVVTSSAVSKVDAERMVDACAEQMLDFCDAWSKSPIEVKLFARAADVPAGMPTIQVADNADEPDALAWHSEDAQGRIIGIVGARTCIEAGGGVLAGSPSVSSALSHELLEAAADPFINEWVDMPGGRRSVAKEVCDPVQDGSYTIGGVDVSNFVLPSWFDAEGSGALDKMGQLTAPFTRTSGGYMVLRVEGGKTVQDGMRPPWKAAAGRGAARAEQPEIAPWQADEPTLKLVLEQAKAHGAPVEQIVRDCVRAARARASA